MRLMAEEGERSRGSQEDASKSPGDGTGRKREAKRVLSKGRSLVLASSVIGGGWQ